MAARPVAVHCAELLPCTAPSCDHLAIAGEVAGMVAGTLGACLAPIAHGPALAATPGAAANGAVSGLINRLGRQSAHCVLTIGQAALLLSVDFRAALALTDRAYGGSGEVPNPLPASLPMSADLTLRQFQDSLCHGLATGFAHLPTPPAVNRRGCDLGRLDPFRGRNDCVTIDLAVAQDGHDPWTVTLAASLPDLERLADALATPAAPKAASRTPADPLDGPLADLPLLARAVLGEARLPLSRLARLAPGDLLPLSIARHVPLRIGETIVAHGAIGSHDDRVALQIVRTP